MIRWFHRHTISTGVLAILFLVFTVGIPIVVSSCPMMKPGPSPIACCRSVERSSGEGNVVTKAATCCGQTIVLTPTSAVYIQSSPARKVGADLPTAIVPDVTGDVVSVFASAGTLSVPFGCFPPQRGEHLTILHSSLLI